MDVFKKELVATRTVKLNSNIDIEEIKNMQILSHGVGSFGIVYKAKWRESEVAVKTIRQESCSAEVIKDFLNECYTMESLRHPNICLFYGACTKDIDNLALIMEYCKNGTLWTFLHNLKYKITIEQKL